MPSRGTYSSDHVELIPVVTVRCERQIVSFGQPRHQPLWQFRTVQERDTAQQRRNPEQQRRDAEQQERDPHHQTGDHAQRPCIWRVRDPEQQERQTYK